MKSHPRINKRNQRIKQRKSAKSVQSGRSHNKDIHKHPQKKRKEKRHSLTKQTRNKEALTPALKIQPVELETSHRVPLLHLIRWKNVSQYDLGEELKRRGGVERNTRLVLSSYTLDDDCSLAIQLIGVSGVRLFLAVFQSGARVGFEHTVL